MVEVDGTRNDATAVARRVEFCGLVPFFYVLRAGTLPPAEA